MIPESACGNRCQEPPDVPRCSRFRRSRQTWGPTDEGREYRTNCRNDPEIAPICSSSGAWLQVALLSPACQSIQNRARQAWKGDRGPYLSGRFGGPRLGLGVLENYREEGNCPQRKQKSQRNARYGAK